MNLAMRLSISVLLTGGLAAYVYFNQQSQGEKLFMYSFPIFLSVYFLTGMINIINPKVRNTGFAMITTWGLYELLIEKSYLSEPLPLFAFSIITVSGTFAFLIIVANYLFFGRQSSDDLYKKNPELYEAIKKVLHEQWVPKDQNSRVIDYSAFIPEIYSLLAKKNNVNKLSSYLSISMQCTLGLTPDKQHNTYIAQILVEIYEYKQV